MHAPTHGPVAAARMPSARFYALPRGALTLTSRFWSPIRRTNRDVALGHGWEMLEQSGNTEAFRIAAGRSKARPRGPLFRDSDLYKWLEAVAWEYGAAPDQALERWMDDAIELIASAQESSGYVNTYYQLEAPERRWQDLRDGHELYCAGHLIQAAVAHVRTTGSRRLLDLACRFADHIDARFGPNKLEGTPGHPEIETALVELWRTTNERRYLELARYFIDARGHGVLGDVPWFFGGVDYYQDRQSVRESRELRGHAVRQLYLCAGAADLYLETGDTGLLAALEAQWRDLCDNKLYVTGGIGARHQGETFGGPYELPNARAYAETCAAIAAIQFGWRMLLAQGSGAIGDVIERVLYNGFLSGVSRDGRHYFYVNPLASDGGIERPEWHGCACCPPNVMRLLSSLEHYFATQTPDGVQIHQYGDLTLSLSQSELGPELGFEMVANYPWESRIAIRITHAEDRPLSLWLRIPSACSAPELSLDGRALAARRAEGYLEIERRFAPGELIELDLGFAPRALVAHPRVENCRGALAFERGPIVYCLEQADVPDGMDFHSIRVDPRRPVAATFDAELLGGVTSLELDADVMDPSIWDERLYAGFEDIETRRTGSTKLRLVPYYAWANRGPGRMAVWLPVRSR